MSNDTNGEWTPEDEAYAIEHSQDIVEEHVLTVSPDTRASPTRIAEDLEGRVGSWRGVTGCCDSSRALKNLRPHFDSWVKATMAARPGSTLIAKGWYAGQVKCKSKTSWDGTRSCKGRFTKIVCYVDIE